MNGPLHPAAESEHVRKIVDKLRALETRLIMKEMHSDGNESHLIGQAVIAIDVLGRELDRRQRMEQLVTELAKSDPQWAQDGQCPFCEEGLSPEDEHKLDCLWVRADKEVGTHRRGPTDFCVTCGGDHAWVDCPTPADDLDYIKDGIKDGWLDEAGNVNEPPTYGEP